MFSTRKSLDKILQAYKKEIRRQISKTTSVTNSDAMAPRLDQPTSKLPQNDDVGPKKLLKLQKYHRFLSTLTTQEMPMATRGLAVSKDQSREFMACFPDIVRDLTETGKHIDVPEASKWLAKLLQYNVPNGKKNRGLATVLAYKMLEKRENLTPENVHLANMMGWCVEMFHTHQLLLSDIMEGTEMRRGAPCWYRRPDVGLTGLNDASLLQSAMFSTLKRHFHNKTYYKIVLETFNESLAMPFHVIQTMEKGQLKLAAVPDLWVHNNVLFWPKKSAEKLRRQENCQPDASWEIMPCLVKRKCLRTFQEANDEIDAMSDKSETEADESYMQSNRTNRNKKSVLPEKSFNDMAEVLMEMLLKCSIGHYMEKLMMKADKPDMSLFTMEKYEAITKYKTSYHTFQMPVTLALLMSGVDDPEKHRQAKTILLEMGEFFQIQDDFLDCFGDPAVTGKNGTYIQDGKCTWLAVVALQRANPKQRQFMEETYGSSDPEAVAKIKDLYEELQLPHTYSVFEEATYDLLRTQIQQVTRGLPHDLFFKILDNIFRRSI